jgi:hypothetical protein
MERVPPQGLEEMMALAEEVASPDFLEKYAAMKLG